MGTGDARRYAAETQQGFSLALALQKNVSQAERMPDNSATIIDGMLLIQKVAGDQANFGEIAMFVQSMALHE